MSFLDVLDRLSDVRGSSSEVFLLNGELRLRVYIGYIEDRQLLVHRFSPISLNLAGRKAVGPKFPIEQNMSPLTRTLNIVILLSACNQIMDKENDILAGSQVYDYSKYIFLLYTGNTWIPAIHSSLRYMLFLLFANFVRLRTLGTCTCTCISET